MLVNLLRLFQNSTVCPLLMTDQYLDTRNDIGLMAFYFNLNFCSFSCRALSSKEVLWEVEEGLENV